MKDDAIIMPQSKDDLQRMLNQSNTTVRKSILISPGSAWLCKIIHQNANWRLSSKYQPIKPRKLETEV